MDFLELWLHQMHSLGCYEKLEEGRQKMHVAQRTDVRVVVLPEVTSGPRLHLRDAWLLRGIGKRISGKWISWKGFVSGKGVA